MILIGQYDSPFVRRVAIAMTRYGIPYEHRPWSVWANADELARYNPLRRVPVLVLPEGTALVESWSILDALDEMVGEERALLPSTGPKRRDGLRVAALATGLADKAVSLFYEHVLRPREGRSPVWVDRCQAQIRDTLGLLEAERARVQSAYWLGEDLSHADIAVAAALRFLGEAHPSLFPAGRDGGWPALAAHAARCEALAEFQQIVQPLRVQLPD
jgi:glutathione S-transferase